MLSALVKRFKEANKNGVDKVTLWGTGSPRRQFVHVSDVVKGLAFFMENVATPEAVNLSAPGDMSIRELAELIAELCEYRGKLEWDTSRPDGMPRKCLDVTRMEKLGLTCDASGQYVWVRRHSDVDAAPNPISARIPFVAVNP